MGSFLQIITGILITGILTGFILVIVWGLIYVLMAKVKDNFYLHRSAQKMKQNFTT